MVGSDLSFKDKKYFIDGGTYNCPFCNRRNVLFHGMDRGQFSWSNIRTVYFYIIKCSESDCLKSSFHLSDYYLETYTPYETNYFKFTNPLRFHRNDTWKTFNVELNDAFFFHQPTSFFTVDSRIPREIREPLDEGENCRKSNFLTGASACLRKSIYKILKNHEIPEKNGDSFIPYEDRIDLLKKKFPNIEEDFFSGLKAVHGLTSQELHENDWEDFDSNTLLFLQGVAHQVLYEIYVLPDESIQRKSQITKLKELAFGKKEDSQSTGPEEGGKEG